MSEVYVYPNGTTERRYTRGEAKWVFRARVAVVVFTFPLLMVTRAIVGDSDVFWDRLSHKSIRLIDGGSYP